MNNYKKTAFPYIIWAFLFIIVSLLMVFYYAFTSDTNTLTFENFVRFFNGSSLVTLLQSLKIALITTIICLLVGYPFAFLVSRMKFKYRTIALMLVIIPMWMNFLLRTYSWVNILSRNGMLNSLLDIFGISKVDIIYTQVAVVIGMVYNFLPFMVLPIYTVFDKMDHSLIEAAYDLGCNKYQTFRKVIFPLSISGIISGVIMVFIPAISTFEITALLGGNKTNLIGNIIEQQFSVVGDWHYGSAISVVLMSFLLLSIVFNKINLKIQNRKIKSSRLELDGENYE